MLFHMRKLTFLSKTFKGKTGTFIFEVVIFIFYQKFLLVQIKLNNLSDVNPSILHILLLLYWIILVI